MKLPLIIALFAGWVAVSEYYRLSWRAWVQAAAYQFHAMTGRDLDAGVVLATAAVLFLTHLAYTVFWKASTWHFETKPSAAVPAGRKIGEVPPPYPTGWFRVMCSHELKVKDAKYIQVLGTHLVVFRGEDGKAAILDAYCPHLGANLGVGSEVVGNCVRCPFHGWEFQADGLCAKIPYADKVPKFAKTKSWPVREVNKMIFVWHDVDGGEPTWEIPVIDEVDRGRYTLHGKSFHRIGAHIQDIPESVADNARMDQEHTTHMWGMVQKWKGRWRSGDDCKEDSFTSRVSIDSRMTACGVPVPTTSVHVESQYAGPGFVHHRCNTTWGKLIIIEAITPTEPMMQNGTVTMYAEWRVPRIIGKMALRAFVSLFERDIPIWNSRTYIANPLTVPVAGKDEGVVQFRKWFQQFYPKSGGKKQEAVAAVAGDW